MKNGSKEFDIIGVVRKVLDKKILLLKFVGVFTVMGVIFALNIQKQYTATVTLAPEASSMGMSSSISDIAGMVGLSVGNNKNSVDAIYPDIYPDIFASTDFIVKLFDIPVKQKKDVQTKSYYQHLITDTKMPFWAYPQYWIISLFQKKEPATRKTLNLYELTKEQYKICKIIRSSIGCQMSKGTNIINIYATDVDPYVAATIADTLQFRLQEYITLYRTQKVRNDLVYSKKLMAEAKAQYKKSQQLYASYMDANNDVVLQSIRSKQEELENDMQLKYNNYNQTVVAVQQAVAKVQERTPAFTIIQEASVPLEASSTPRSYIVIFFIILGCISDAIWVLFLRDLFQRKTDKNSNK